MGNRFKGLMTATIAAGAVGGVFLLSAIGTEGQAPARGAAPAPAGRGAAQPAARGAARTKRPAAETGMLLPAVCVHLAAIELLALVLVAEDVERRGDAFELLFRGRVVLVRIGVVLLGQLAEGLADVIRRGRPGHPEFKIRIARQEPLASGIHRRLR